MQQTTAAENDFQRVTRSLYKKTLKSLRQNHGFYEATDAAIKAEILATKDVSAKDRIYQEKGLVIYHLGTLLIKRHPKLIV